MENQIKQIALNFLAKKMEEEFDELMKASYSNAVFQTREEVRKSCMFPRNKFYVDSLIGILEMTAYFDDDGTCSGTSGGIKGVTIINSFDPFNMSIKDLKVMRLMIDSELQKRNETFSEK